MIPFSIITDMHIERGELMEVYEEGIDIIIPAYNAQNIIEKALYSIALQKRIDNFNVYIVNDCSNNSYEKQINKFKKYYQITYLLLQKSYFHI